MTQRTKVKKTYNIILRLLILVATWGFIYTKIFKNEEWLRQFSSFRDFYQDPVFVRMLVLVVFLMIVNWSLETVKWRFMIGKIEHLSFLRAFQAVLTGSSVSIATPNRIGEYFGRVFVLEKASHVQGILITILGSMSQLLITILTGSVGLILFTFGNVHQTGFFSGYLYYTVLALIIILDFLLLLLYFNISFLATLREKLLKKRLKKFRAFFVVFSYFRYRDLCHIITLSFLRYLVFSLQYFILLRMFQVEIPLFPSLVITSLIFFVITVIPTVALTELGIRDSVSLYFFSIYFAGTGLADDTLSLGILLASTMLWVINLAIPALIGTIFVSRLKFFRKNDNGNSTA
jgi:MFS family permease